MPGHNHKKRHSMSYPKNNRRNSVFGLELPERPKTAGPAKEKSGEKYKCSIPDEYRLFISNEEVIEKSEYWMFGSATQTEKFELSAITLNQIHKKSNWRHIEKCHQGFFKYKLKSSGERVIGFSPSLEDGVMIVLQHYKKHYAYEKALSEYWKKGNPKKCRLAASVAIEKWRNDELGLTEVLKKED